MIGVLSRIVGKRATHTMNTSRILGSLFLGYSLLYAPISQGRSEGELGADLVNPGHHEQPAWFKTSFLDIREDVAEAGASNKRVMLYFYQDGCPYCKKLLEDNFGQAGIAEKTQRYFDTVAINLWGDREVGTLNGKSMSEKQFAVEQKVMFTPTLLMLDENGAVVLRINGYFPPERFNIALDYAGGKHEKTASFRDYLTQQAPQPSSGRLHISEDYVQPPYFLAQLGAQSDKPLLILFEQRQCVPCDELHNDIFQRKESQVLLKKFNVVVLDMWSKARVQTPQGLNVTAKDWAQSLEVSYAPSMIFFDNSGHLVFRTDGLLKAFHTQSVLDYVASGAYRQEPEFQRYIDKRADALRAQGVTVDLMK